MLELAEFYSHVIFEIIVCMSAYKRTSLQPVRLNCDSLPTHNTDGLYLDTICQ